MVMHFDSLAILQDPKSDFPKWNPSLISIANSQLVESALAKASSNVVRSPKSIKKRSREYLSGGYDNLSN